MGDKREITKLEKQIINDIMSRSNYNQEKATEIAKAMIDFGYTIHEQDYYRLKKENKELRKAIKQWNISGGNLLKENTKLKKVIEILKDYFEIWLNYEEEENYGGFEISGYLQINKQEYELLKEVLGNAKDN